MDRNPRVYLGSYPEYVRKTGHEAPGIYSREQIVCASQQNDLELVNSR